MVSSKSMIKKMASSSAYTKVFMITLRVADLFQFVIRDIKFNELTGSYKNGTFADIRHSVSDTLHVVRRP
jgi:hypothetical protein